MPTSTSVATFTWLAQQAVRLLREDPWKNANDLAQEIYAIFKKTGTFEIEAPLVINGNGTSPFIILNGWQPGQVPEFQFNPLGDPPVEFPLSEEPVPEQGGSPSQLPEGQAWPAMVLSGTGANYIVRVYPGGLTLPATDMSAQQLQIDPGATIPPGTWTFVVLAGENLYIQVPVWL